MNDGTQKNKDSGHVPRWPQRLQDLARQQRTAVSETLNNRLRDEMWLLIHTGLYYYLRSQSRRLSWSLEDELHDLATEKSLELLGRIRAGKWELAGLEPLMIVAYFSKVARNCLLDWQRKRKSEQSFVAAAQRRAASEAPRPAPATPLVQLERKEFAQELRCCVELLQPRSRLVWLLRVFGDCSAQQIADNPRLALQVGHVNVLLHRARAQVRNCMARKGFDTTIIPAGCLAEMLQSFDVKRVLPELEADDA